MLIINVVSEEEGRWTRKWSSAMCPAWPWPVSLLAGVEVILMKGSCLFWLEIKGSGLWNNPKPPRERQQAEKELLLLQKIISLIEMFFLFHITSAGGFFPFLFCRRGWYTFNSSLWFLLRMHQRVRTRTSARPRKNPSSGRSSGTGTSRRSSSKHSQHGRNTYRTSAWMRLLKFLIYEWNFWEEESKMKEIVASIEAVGGEDPIPLSLLHVSVVFSGK